MFERLKNFLLTRMYPASLFLLAFCGPKQKEHKIPYAQMPMELSADADSGTRALVGELKQGFTANQYPKFSSRVLKGELDYLKSQNNSDPNNVEQNKALVLATDSEQVQFSKEFLSSIKGPSFNAIKSNLETFIKEQLHTKGSNLVFTKSAKGLLQPLLNKKSDGNSYATLLALIAGQLNSRQDLRSQRFGLIFTPDSISLGFVLRDSEQGPLLFAYPNTALGVKAKYYGPTEKLKGNILLIDLEGFVILKALAPHMTNLDAARAFVIDHSAKKFRYNAAAVSPDFKKEQNHNIFEVLGTSEKLPNDPSDFVESELNFVGGFSQLESADIEASYKAHKENLRRQEEAERLRQEQARLGNNYQLEGKWTQNFGGKDKLAEFVKEQIKGNKIAPEAAMKILTLERNRECHENEETGLEAAKASYLRDWDILGVDESWYFEKLEKDDLGLCRARGPIGTDASPDLVKQYTRILQPLYLFLPANPENLSDADFQLKRVEIKEAQRTLIKEVSKKICSKINMKDVDTQMGTSASSLVRNLWKELYHDEKTTVESSYSELVKDHNYFEIKCMFVPSILPKAAPKDSVKEEEKDPPSRNRRNSPPRIGSTQKRVSIGR